MTIDEHIKYWLDSAAHDLDTAEHLFKSGKYDWCLFIGHLVLEKTLKAFFVLINNNKLPPKIHNLVKLSKLSKININHDQEILMILILKQDTLTLNKSSTKSVQNPFRKNISEGSRSIING